MESQAFYLDYAAATPVDPRVLRAMRPYFSEKFGNPSSLHLAGALALKALDEARARLAQVTRTEFRDVVFTASATEANNLALRGVVRAFSFGDQNNFSPAEKFSFPSAHRAAGHGNQADAPAYRTGRPAGYPREKNTRTTPKIVVSAVEHDSVLLTARDMERAGEIELVIIPVDKRGVVDIKKLESALDERTVLVSVMYVNNEVGTLQPISEIAAIVRNFRSSHTQMANSKWPDHSPFANGSLPLLHTDVAQAFLYYPCNIKELGADLMTLSSQKIYGPKGAGALVGKIDKIHPLITGGGQEFGFRAGTENVPAIVGFAAAAVFAESERKENGKQAAQARDMFARELRRSLRGVEENIPRGSMSAPHIMNIAFPKGVSSEDLLVLFDREGIAASPGAACSARALTLSHVLRAIGIPDERIRRSIRFSFGRGITAAGAKAAAQKVKTLTLSLTQ